MENEKKRNYTTPSPHPSPDSVALLPHMIVIHNARLVPPLPLDTKAPIYIQIGSAWNLSVHLHRKMYILSLHYS